MSSNYQLVRLAKGSFSIHSTAARETFHPVAGPIAEAEALYVQQLKLRERMRECPDEFVIWDVGLGAGGNVLTTLRCMRDVPGSLRVISFDRTTEALAFALEHASELGFTSGYEAQLRELVAHGKTEFQNEVQNVRWQTIIADFPEFISRSCAKAAALPSPDAIFFDAFSPKRNPEMWSLPLFSNLFSSLDPNRPCSLATFSRSTIARTALLLAGFFVGCGDALAGKEETTIASNTRQLVPKLLDREWLARAQRSHSAEPLDGHAYIQCPLAPATWEKLCAHSQFS